MMKIETVREVVNTSLTILIVCSCIFLALSSLFSFAFHSEFGALTMLAVSMCFLVCFFICIVARILLELLLENKE